MPKASYLQFHNYRVEELSYKSLPVNDGQHEFELHPNFQHHLVDCDDNNYDVHLSIDIPSTEEWPMPFELKVALVGRFTFQDPEGEVSAATQDYILKKNTVSILFPFLRSIVASITTNANIPPLVLPIMNFSDDN